MASRRRFSFQLYEQGGAGALAGQVITATGGKVYVTAAGAVAKASITDKDGTALANPRSLTNGSCEFYTLATVDKVDIYLMAPGGQFVVIEDLTESLADIAIDTTNVNQLAVIPFSIADTTASTETDTGFDLPENCIVLNRLHGEGLKITTADAAITMDVGLGEAVPVETGGDANGFNAAASLTTLGYLAGTDGAFFSTNAPYMISASVARSITYTLSAGADTAVGFILLPYRLCKAGV
jgi:hypothetical protein